MAEEDPVCSHFQQAAELVAKRWNPQIVLVLLGGSRRFGELRSAIPGLSDHLLSARLKELEAADIVVRTVTPSRPVRIGYALTQRGRDLRPAIDELGAWAERWAAGQPSELSG
jgi:DNA-binding HxlR family transcriptional regulator